MYDNLWNSWKYIKAFDNSKTIIEIYEYVWQSIKNIKKKQIWIRTINAINEIIKTGGDKNNQ